MLWIILVLSDNIIKYSLPVRHKTACIICVSREEKDKVIKIAGGFFFCCFTKTVCCWYIQRDVTTQMWNKQLQFKVGYKFSTKQTATFKSLICIRFFSFYFFLNRINIHTVHLSLLEPLPASQHRLHSDYSLILSAHIWQGWECVSPFPPLPLVYYTSTAPWMSKRERKREREASPTSRWHQCSIEAKLEANTTPHLYWDLPVHLCPRTAYRLCMCVRGGQ